MYVCTRTPDDGISKNSGRSGGPCHHPRPRNNATDSADPRERIRIVCRCLIFIGVCRQQRIFGTNIGAGFEDDSDDDSQPFFRCSYANANSDGES